MRSGAAVTRMPSNGASSGQPRYPSAARTSTLRIPSSFRRSAADAASSGRISIEYTFAASSARIAVW